MAHWRTVDALAARDVAAVRGGWEVDGRRVSLADVTAILVGEKCSLTVDALHEAARFHVPILVCDWRGVPVSQVLPWSEHNRVCARHRAQANLSVPRGKQAWKRIVQTKLKGQSESVAAVGSKMSDRIRGMVSSVKSGDTGGAEAQAARWYWKAMLPGENRVPGTGKGRNAMLDYGYAIIRGITIRAVCEAGLWPTLGIWHQSRGNGFALADDLMEPLRPAADHAARQQWDDGHTSLDQAAVKHALVAAIIGEPGAGSGPTLSLATTIAQRFAQYVEDPDVTLELPYWQVPHRNG